MQVNVPERTKNPLVPITSPSHSIFEFLIYCVINYKKKKTQRQVSNNYFSITAINIQQCEGLSMKDLLGGANR